MGVGSPFQLQVQARVRQLALSIAGMASALLRPNPGRAVTAPLSCSRVQGFCGGGAGRESQCCVSVSVD